MIKEINVGDIVKPSTPRKGEMFGNGIVIATKQPQRQPISVIFIKNGKLSAAHDFIEDHLKLVPVDDNELKLLQKAAYEYSQMSSLVFAA